MANEPVWGIDDFFMLLADPVYLQYLVFNRLYPPHQRLQLRLMWFRPFYVDTSGYRIGKSTIATYNQMGQCVLLSGWQEGILSHTMRGSQYLFRDHIDYQYETNPYFRIFVRKKPTHGSEWRVEFINNSSITAYPADILQNSMRLESLSLHGCTIDEATAFQNPDVLWDVMVNRVTMPPPPLAQRLGITNTVRVLGAAKYTFQSIYKARHGKGGLIHLVIRRMLEWVMKNPDKPLEYVFMTFNLEDHLPPDEVCWVCEGQTQNLGMREDGKEYVKCKSCGYERIAWRAFFRTTLQRMKDAKSLMALKLWLMRWKGLWQDTSDSVYNPNAIANVFQSDRYVELERPKDDKSIYAFGVDIGTGQEQKHSVSAISIVKYNPPDPRFHIVYSRKYRCSLKELSGHIYNLWTKFQPRVIVVDPGGGGVWLTDKDNLASHKQIINGIEIDSTPLVSMDDITDENSAKVIQLYTPTCHMLKNSIGTMIAADHLINWTHEMVGGLIDNVRLTAPATSNVPDGIITREVDSIRRGINEALDGLCEIGIEQDEDGTPLLTGNGFFSYVPKPDMAYSLVYALSGLTLITHPELTREDTDESIAIIADAYDTVRRGGKSRIVNNYDSEESGIAIVS